MEKQIEEFIEKCHQIYPEEMVKKIEQAVTFAKESHGEKKRLDGSPYLMHPLAVSEILLDYGVDGETILASILHETINHGNSTEEEIEENFGSEVASIVGTISKLNHLELNDDSLYSAMNLRKILVGMSEDVRVLLLKLADRLHNLRTADALDKETLKKKVTETMNVLIPIAHRLGMYQMKGEMEDLCLKYSKPDVYADILERLSGAEKKLKDSLEEMEESISEMLDEHNIHYRMKSRVKSVYSIYNKLNNGKSWDTIYDILALRVIVEEVSDCYLTIGLIHAKYRPIPGRFKDYIANPKQNMYQSLHTGVFGSDGNRYEIQVRTEEMDEYAEKGVASHFAYKEKHYMKNVMEQKLEIFRNLIESSESLSDVEFQSNIEAELFSESIYVFTPKGDVLELPKGATPIDFAYRIHSDVGDKTVGAIVNDVIVPLSHPLQNDDVVTIKTSANSTPNKEWLNFVVTSHARNKIKAYFSKQEKENYTESGKNILLNELRKKKIPFDTLFTQENVKRICEELKLENLDELYFSIGTLRFTASYIIAFLTEEKKDIQDILLEKVQRKSNDKNTNKGDILVNGYDNILVTLGKCCHPVYGDEIVGFITKGEGITVHKKECKNVSNKKERMIDVSWNMKEDATYAVTLQVIVEPGKNHVADLVSRACEKNISVDAISTKEKENTTIYEMTIKVKDKEELDGFMNSLEMYSFVKEVERI